MVDVGSLYDQHKDLSTEEQKKAGKAIEGAMPDAYTAFLKRIAEMIKRGEINVFEPQSFVQRDAYETLNEQSRSQVDVSLLNIADQLRHVADFYLSKETPDSSPQLQFMIDHLWQMKSRMEGKYGSLLKF